MLVLPQEVEITLSSGIKHYEDLGYEIPKSVDKCGRLRVKRGTKIKVRVEDLPVKSKIKIQVQCDYCGKIVFKTCLDYSDGRIIIQKDCCSDVNCKKKKRKEVMIVKYGVINITCIPSIMEQIKNKLKTNKDIVDKDFLEKGLIVIGDYFNRQTPVECICIKHINKGIQKIRYASIERGYGCTYCGYEIAAIKNSGENNYNWQGGITTLISYLRKKIIQWKKDSMEFCNYKCVITGERFDVIHHLYGFTKILQESLDELNFPLYSQINKYTFEQLELLEEKFLEIHYKYPLGACITRDLHLEFHSIYGRGNNTPEQFEEFKQMKISQLNREIEVVK